MNVNLGKIKKKLKREVTAHPAKAAVLGGLCVVAMWFWVPLVWGWVSPKEPSAAATVAREPSAMPVPGFVPTSVSVPPAEATPAVPAVPWTQIVQWMEQDPRTSSVEVAFENPGTVPLPPGDERSVGLVQAARRDPFRPSVSPEDRMAVNAEEAAPEVAPVPAKISPRDAGATITAVIASPTGGTAMISGRTYFLGEQVLLHKDNEAYTFRLTEIHPGGVVLTRDGMRYELNIPLPANMPRPAARAGAPETGTRP